MSEQTSNRARVAALSRSRSADDPEYTAARRDLAAANIKAAIHKHLAVAPPLKRSQIDELTHLLRRGVR